ncbi:MAG TPA: ferrochelatase [Thermomicrobiales bacterium]|nr:ferrochelatase [Thermomicrobiales bacterium]HQZ88484.1 ferrochelatase [Thermomicrobiales bacterium]HRA30386.1 ferrochelatase [Thermomicrobiales bacterium]
MRTIGVLMMAYGGPNNLDEIEPYLADIRNNRPTSPELLEEITSRYRQIGGRSPILELTRAQATGVERALNDAAPEGIAYRTYVGMRHWHPYIGEVVPQMLADGVEAIAAIVMAPHFSRMSVGAYLGKLNKALVEQGSTIPVIPIESWKDEPAFIEAVARRINDALDRFAPEKRADVPLLFTAHSLPARILESGDPYREELQASVALVVERLQPRNWRWAFQSQGATAEPWLGPTVEDTLEELAAQGFDSVLFVPIGFVCDHVEVLYDIDIEHKHQANELGIRLERINMLNDDPGLVAAVAHAVSRAVMQPTVGD